MKTVVCTKHGIEAQLPSSNEEHLKLIDEVNRVILHSAKYPDCKFQVKLEGDDN